MISGMEPFRQKKTIRLYVMLQMFTLQAVTLARMKTADAAPAT